MQLLEYFIWKKTISNKSLSQIGLIIILLQPIFSILTLNDNINYRWLIKPFIALYFILIICVIYSWSNIDFRSIKGPNGHLSWRWLDFSTISILIWCVFVFVPFILRKDWLSTAFLFITGSLSYILYNKSLTWGSMWCWLANLVAFYLVFIVLYKAMICGKCAS